MLLKIVSIDRIKSKKKRNIFFSYINVIYYFYLLFLTKLHYILLKKPNYS